MRGLIIRIFKQMINDKRSLALIFLAPLLILSLLYLLLGKSSYKPTIAVNAGAGEQMIKALKKQDLKLSSISEDEKEDTILKNADVDAVVTIDKTGVKIKMLEANSTKASKVTEVVRKALEEVNPLGKMNISFIYGKSDATTFDSLGYMLLGVLSFFFVFIISGMSFVRERTTGTMERLMLTPIKRISVVLGYTIGFGIFAALQSIFIILFTKYILHMEYAGSVVLSIIIMILLSFTAVSLGALVSIFANSEFQVMQFIPIIIIPQIFFSGLISIDTFPFGLGKLAYVMPVYYGCAGLENILVRGAGIDKIWSYILMLLIFIFVLVVINTEALRKYRKI